MKFLPVFCFIFLIIQVGNVCSEYTVDHEVANSIHSTFEMYRKLYNENENFVFSPLSFRIIYSILYQPSRLTSETEIQQLLFDTTNPVPNKSDVITAQTENVGNILGSPNIRLANKIYLANNLRLKRSFKRLVARYRTDIEQVNFQTGSNSLIAERMNQWVENKTNGLIKNLVDSNSVTPEVQLFLINTVYFKADWLVPFSKYNVRPKPFNSIDGQQKMIDAIHEQDHYKIAFNDELNVDVLELPYTTNSGFAFWIILPRETLSLSQLKDNLSVDFVTKIKESLNYNFANIQFPIFEIESTIDGKDLTPGIFGNGEFDIVERQSSTVDEIKQKAKIIVNTKGTEAAAATYAKIVPLSLPMARPIPRPFIVDRPFIYALVSETTKEPIFIGHYSKA